MMLFCHYMMILCHYMMILCHYMIILCHYMMILPLGMFLEKTKWLTLECMMCCINVDFCGLADNFEREKITPDIVCLLFAQDMQKLGITNTVDMMKLRIKC